ncbi:MAG: hypothetical protein DMD36_03540, partial [Gemmatimonadetes bacterium]
MNGHSREPIYSRLVSTPAPTVPDRWGERLSRRLGLWSAVAVLVGSTIGSGIFRTPAGVAQRIDDVPLFLLAWVVGGVAVLCGALTYSELAAAFPRSGGVYVFVREAFGPLPAFLFVWAELWVIRPGAFGAIGITASAYTLRTLGFDPGAVVVGVGPVEIRAEQLLGALYIVVVAVVNYFGVHRGAILQNLSTAFKVGALALLVVLGFALGSPPAVSGGGVFAQRAAVGLSPFLLAMVAILWAYDGWADLAFVGGEVRDPQRTLPRALLIGTATVVVLYLGANLVYLYLIPIEAMKQAELVAADVARLIIGPAGVVVVSAAIAVSTFRDVERIDDDGAADLLRGGRRRPLAEADRARGPAHVGADRRGDTHGGDGRDLHPHPDLHAARRPVHHRHLAVLRARGRRRLRPAAQAPGARASLPHLGIPRRAARVPVRRRAAAR